MENCVSASEEGICVMEFSSESIHDNQERKKERKTDRIT
jgi:hypothetical protein